jgi:hypothetical protein
MEKLNLSQKDYEQMITGGSIRSTSGLDLKKCRLKAEVTLIIESQTAPKNCEKVNFQK